MRTASSARNASGTRWRPCNGSSADDIVKALDRALNEFHGGKPRDDIAFVVLRVPA